MDLELGGSMAVVAASSSGIGRAVAEGFAREGARVIMNGRRGDVLQQAADAIREATNAEVHTVVGDLSNVDACRELIEEADAQFGRIDALFTNTGGPPAKAFTDLTDDDRYAAFDLLLLSAVRLTRFALPYLKQTRGSIVNLTSVSVKQPIPGLTLSNSIRPGVVGLGKTLATELAADGVRVNDVAPGSVWTDRQEYLLTRRAQDSDISLEEAVRRAEADIPMRRYGTPRGVANLVVFLASRAASYITGATVQVDGGIYRGLQ